MFQMPDGEYRLSQTQVAESVCKDESSFRDFLKSKSPEALPYKGLRSVKIGIVGNNTKIAPVPIEMAAAYWTKEAIAKNIVAIRLLGACAIESIERRADKAFGVKRSEEEYNERFAVRMDLKKTKYKIFVAAIALWQKEQGIYKTEKGVQCFKEAHDQMNLRLQDLRSREIKKMNNLKSSALIRDYFGVAVMVDYCAINQIAAKFLKTGQAKTPVEAVNMACDCYLPEQYDAKPCNLLDNINQFDRKLNREREAA